jgi:hypothetical protein
MGGRGLVGTIRRESSATCNVRDLMFMNWPEIGS